jgi:hypothetical protein
MKFPQLSNPCTELDLIRAFNHNAIYGNEKQDKRHVKTYLDVFATTDELKNLKGVNEYVIDSAIATLSHLVSEGYELPDNAKTKFDKEIKKFLRNHQKEKIVIEKSATKEDVELTFRKLTSDELSSSAIGEMEFEIDQLLDNNVKSSFSTYNYIKGKDFKQNVCMEIKRWFKILQKELQYVLTTGLQYKDYRENYNFLTRPQQKRFKKYVDGIILDCDKYMKERRKPRRKKKVISTQDAFDKNLQTI